MATDLTQFKIDLSNSSQTQNYPAIYNNLVDALQTYASQIDVAATTYANLNARLVGDFLAASTAAALFTGTSSTSFDIASSFAPTAFTTQSGKAWAAGLRLRFADRTHPDEDWFIATVLTYSGTTVTVIPSQVVGEYKADYSGSSNDWSITIQATGYDQDWLAVYTAANLSSNTTISVADRVYYCDTTSGAFTVTFPANPTLNTKIGIIDLSGKFATNNLTINPNGQKIMGLNENLIIQENWFSKVFIMHSSGKGWVPAH